MVQVSLNQRAHCITFEGKFLKNGLPVRINNKQDVNMGLRLAANLAKYLSPYKININPIEGSISIATSCFIDAEFEGMAYVLKSTPTGLRKLWELVQNLWRIKLVLLLFYGHKLSPSQLLTIPNKIRLNLNRASKHLKQLEDSLFVMGLDAFEEGSD